MKARAWLMLALTAAVVPTVTILALNAGKRPSGEHAHTASPPSQATAPPDGLRRYGSHRNGDSLREASIGIHDPLYQPKTQEEVDWLNRNLYPSSQVLQEANSSRPTLSATDFTGPVTARMLAAAEVAALSRKDLAPAAKKALNRAAILGSTFALESLGRIYSHPTNANAVMAEAHYLAAEIRGDWAIAARPRSNLDPEQMVLARLLGHQIILNLDKERRRLGLPPLRPDYRPGLESTLSKIRDNSPPR